MTFDEWFEDNYNDSKEEFNLKDIEFAFEFQQERIDDLECANRILKQTIENNKKAFDAWIIRCATLEKQLAESHKVGLKMAAHLEKGKEILGNAKNKEEK